MQSLGVRAATVCQFLVRDLEGIILVFLVVIVDVVSTSISQMGKLRLREM